MDCIILGYNQTYRYYENGYQELDSIQIYDLYQENNILDVISKSELINYGYDIEKYLKNKDLNLYYKKFIGFNKTCQKNRLVEFNLNQLEELQTLDDKMNKWSNWAKGFVSISEISSVFTLIKLFNNNKKLTVNFIAG